MKLSTENFLDPLVRQEAAALFRLYTGHDPVTADRILEGYAKRPSAVAVTARSELGDLVGFGMASFPAKPDEWIEAVERMTSVMHDDAWVITELHVAPMVRKMGIGSAILWRLECLCPHRLYSILGVDAQNHAAQALYKKHYWFQSGRAFIPKGFVTRQILMEKSLFAHPPSPPSPSLSHRQSRTY